METGLEQHFVKQSLSSVGFCLCKFTLSFSTSSCSIPSHPLLAGWPRVEPFTMVNICQGLKYPFHSTILLLLSFSVGFCVALVLEALHGVVCTPPWSSLCFCYNPFASWSQKCMRREMGWRMSYLQDSHFWLFWGWIELNRSLEANSNISSPSPFGPK